MTSIFISSAFEEDTWGMPVTLKCWLHLPTSSSWNSVHGDSVWLCQISGRFLLYNLHVMYSHTIPPRRS